MYFAMLCPRSTGTCRHEPLGISGTIWSWEISLQQRTLWRSSSVSSNGRCEISHQRKTDNRKKINAVMFYLFLIYFFNFSDNYLCASDHFPNRILSVPTSLLVIIFNYILEKISFNWNFTGIGKIPCQYPSFELQASVIIRKLKKFSWILNTWNVIESSCELLCAYLFSPQNILLQ